MIIIQDTREQIPLVFPSAVVVEVGTLQTGDYSIRGLESLFSVERKSIDDLVGSVTRERERFERELHRLRGFQFRRLLIIGSEADLLAGKFYGNANPKAIFASLGAFEVRYSVPVVWADTPNRGGELVARWAHWFSREITKQAEALNTEAKR